MRVTLFLLSALLLVSTILAQPAGFKPGNSQKGGGPYDPPQDYGDMPDALPDDFDFEGNMYGEDGEHMHGFHTDPTVYDVEKLCANNGCGDMDAYQKEMGKLLSVE